MQMEEDRLENRNNERILQETSDPIRKSNIRIISISEEEREKRTESIFEQIVNENFPNLWKGK